VTCAEKRWTELYIPPPAGPASGPKAELCAVAALEDWLETVGPTRPLFRSFDLRGQLTEKRCGRPMWRGSSLSASTVASATSSGGRCRSLSAGRLPRLADHAQDASGSMMSGVSLAGRFTRSDTGYASIAVAS
jgi:hypothetical protein